jgi:hypothetical protein
MKLLDLNTIIYHTVSAPVKEIGTAFLNVKYRSSLPFLPVFLASFVSLVLLITDHCLLSGLNGYRSNGTSLVVKFMPPSAPFLTRIHLSQLPLSGAGKSSL